MANLFLTGSGVPTNAVGEVTDYYRDTITNLIYYYAPTGWEVVPSLIPTPDGVGTNWLFGTGAPNSGVGSTNDYYRDDANGSVYRKHAVNGWEAKGSLDFIGVYGVQWGEGTGAPANIPSLNNLPAGSFYLDVATSDIYYKDNTLTWSNKGQLGGSGAGGGSGIREDVTFISGSIVANASVSGTVSISPRYQLLQITTNYPCRVRLYTSTAKRDADLTRTVGIDPEGNHGLMLEFISSTELLSADLSPLVDGFADTSAIAYSITNLSGATQTINVTLNHVKTGA
jgi:hypothetical protein